MLDSCVITSGRNWGFSWWGRLVLGMNGGFSADKAAWTMPFNMAFVLVYSPWVLLVAHFFLLLGVPGSPSWRAYPVVCSTVSLSAVTLLMIPREGSRMARMPLSLSPSPSSPAFNLNWFPVYYRINRDRFLEQTLSTDGE